MTKEQAITEARQNAIEHKCVMVVVDAPIENAEDETGPFNYCPAEAVKTLFKYGKVVVIIAADGTVYEKR